MTEILVLLLLFAMGTHVTTKCLRRAELRITKPACEHRTVEQLTFRCKTHSKLGKIIRCARWNTNRLDITGHWDVTKICCIAIMYLDDDPNSS
jgi:hypothetical protein